MRTLRSYSRHMFSGRKIYIKPYFNRIWENYRDCRPETGTADGGRGSWEGEGMLTWRWGRRLWGSQEKLTVCRPGMVGRILQRGLTTARDVSRSVELRCVAKVKQWKLTSWFCSVKCNIEVKLLFVIGTPPELRKKTKNRLVLHFSKYIPLPDGMNLCSHALEIGKWPSRKFYTILQGEIMICLQCQKNFVVCANGSSQN